MRAPAGTVCFSQLQGQALLPSCRQERHGLCARILQKLMGSPRLAALLLSLPLLLIGLAVSARVACPCLRSWTSHCLLAYRVDKRFAGRAALSHSQWRYGLGTVEGPSVGLVPSLGEEI